MSYEQWLKRYVLYIMSFYGNYYCYEKKQAMHISSRTSLFIAR